MELEILPAIDPILCDGCGRCVDCCPSRSLALVGHKALLVRPDLCAYDGACELVCPVGAIQVPYEIVFGDHP